MAKQLPSASKSKQPKDTTKVVATRAPKSSARKGTTPDRRTGNQSARDDIWAQLFSVGGTKGFRKPDPGTYDQYRKMSRYPTIALGTGRLCGTILSTPWSWVLKDGAPQKWLDEAKAVFDPLQHDLKSSAIPLAIRYGWSPFEVVYDNAGGINGIETFVPLLVDLSDFLSDEKGRVCGLRNKSNGLEVDLMPDEYFAFTCRDEGENPYGISWYENIRPAHGYALQTIGKLARYMDMKSQTIGQIHYPEGTSKDAGGADVNNYVLALKMAKDLADGKTLLFPNHFASMLSDPNNQPTAAILEKALAAAGKSSWVVSWLENGGTDYAPGMIQSLQTFDVQLIRGLKLPERSVLEAQHGGLGTGDSGEGSDVATTTESLLYTDFCEQVNKGPLNRFLEMNFGKEAVDAVSLEAPPLDDDKKATIKDFIKTMMANTAVGTEIAAMTGVPEMLDDLDVPVDDEKRKTWGDALTQPTTPLGPDGQPIAPPGTPPNSAALQLAMNKGGAKPPFPPGKKPSALPPPNPGAPQLTPPKGKGK